MMSKSRAATVMVLASALSVSLTACNEPSPDTASLKYSEDLYDGCVPCHGAKGEGNSEIGAPSIAGLANRPHASSSSTVWPMSKFIIMLP